MALPLPPVADWKLMIPDGPVGLWAQAFAAEGADLAFMWAISVHPAVRGHPD